MKLYYGTINNGCPIHGAVELADKNAPKLGMGNDPIERIWREVQGGRMTIHPELFHYTNNYLQAGIDQIFSDIVYDDQGFEMVQKFRRNIARFSAYKARELTVVLELSAMEDAPAMDKLYNTNWLRTEGNHVKRSCQSAEEWLEIEADKDLYPYLKYEPSVSAEPRTEHKKLYGIIKHVDDPFWDVWLPPSAWNCNCWVSQQTTDKGSKEMPKKIKLPPKSIRNNPAKTGKIITDHHPMIAISNEAIKKGVEKTLQTFIPDIPFAEGVQYIGKKGTIKTHYYADPSDIDENMVDAIRIADQYDVEILINPHTNADGIKNPEFVIDGIVGDRFERKGNATVRNTILNNIRKKLNSKKGQLSKNTHDKVSLVINLKEEIQKDKEAIASALYGQIKNYPHLKLVYILGKNEMVMVETKKIKSYDDLIQLF
ncbi:phage minor head protein [Flammeovirga sp. OC4]|uniref:phage minor head protein n=1 Tax=Flammeovirga sp. OC4 TaxID=1382345 RepID=UPI0005C68147|nr:phage minor head protein [Flammeovirga sp. OC4]